MLLLQISAHTTVTILHSLSPSYGQIDIVSGLVGFCNKIARLIICISPDVHIWLPDNEGIVTDA